MELKFLAPEDFTSKIINIAQKIEHISEIALQAYAKVERI